jgi:DNA-binding LacI/PurR family transcriptional regulator
MQIIKKRGLRIPQDIAVVGFSNDQISELIEPSLTTLSQPITKIGETAAELLLHLINTDISLWKPITQTLNTELIIRKSTIG